MLADFPPHVQAQIQRILDAEARRLLAEELAREADESSQSGSTGPEA
jgi:hypothetical protein